MEVGFYGRPAGAYPATHPIAHHHKIQPIMKKFNINDCVKVKLTSQGKAVLQQQLAERVQRWNCENRCPYQSRPKDANGYIKFQMWELMHIFGNDFYNGCQIPFETTVLIEDKDLEDDGSWKAKIAR